MKKAIILFLVTFYNLSLWGQSSVLVTGRCLDRITSKGISLVTIYDRNSNTFTRSDSSGRYQMTLSKGKISLEASFVGYSSQQVNFRLTTDTIIDFYFKPSSILGEVKVTDKRIKDVVNTVQIGEIAVSSKMVAALPAIGGEPDLIKVLQLLPGVQNGAEGRSGLYVRGGGPDQNLILVDGVPLIDVSHLAGFFSIFNSDAIESVSLKKGSFAARYGGRLSSLLDIKMKTGQKDSIGAKLGIGLIASRLTIDGPIKKGKSTFLFSARRTYPDIPIGIINKLSEQDGPNGHLDSWKLHFYDIYGKASFSLTEKNQLIFSGFLSDDIYSEAYTIGKDEFTISDDFGNRVKNKMGALKWNYRPKKRTNLMTTFALTEYYTQNFSSIEEKGVDVFLSKDLFKTSIRNWLLKTDIHQHWKQHDFRLGLGQIYHQYQPGSFSSFSNNPLSLRDTVISSGSLTSVERFGYVEDDWTIGRLRANLGMRLSYYQTGDRKFLFPEPRVALRYLLGTNWSVKASYSNMTQYVNLIANGLGAPFNIWSVTSGRLKPQIGNQFSVGLAMKKQEFELSLDGFYKKMDNVLANRGISGDFNFTETWDKRVIQGKGESYGGELFVNRKVGKLSGWLGYSLSWNWRQFELLNNGKRYPFKYDRRHDLKVVLNYKKSTKTSFSAVWVYGSGNALTLPIALGQAWPSYRAIYPNKYSHFLGDPIFIYSKKNEFRAPAYHRLDLGIRLTKEKKHGFRTWAFGLYNAYARANPYYLYAKEVYKANGDGEQKFDHYGIFRKSMFTLVPSASYIFKFK